MANRRNKTNVKDERMEDTTLYGEFIPSFDQWTTSEGQRNRARYLEEITEEIAPGKGEIPGACKGNKNRQNKQAEKT